MGRKVPVVIQIQWNENAAATLSMILGYYKKYVHTRAIREVCLSSRSGTTPEQLCDAAGKFGLETEKMKCPAEELLNRLKEKDTDVPMVVGWRRRYYAIIRKIKDNKIYITDAVRGEDVLTFEKFKTLYSGICIQMKPGENFTADGKRESLTEIIGKRIHGFEKTVAKAGMLNGFAVLADLILLSLNVNMLDKVVSGDQPQYFLPLMIGMLACILLSLFFSVSRTLRVYKTGKQMASSSGAAVFKKLMRLPLSYFEQTSAGELLERLEKNSSLDYSIIQTLLPRMVNTVQTILYIGMLFFYNWELACACLILEGIYIYITIGLHQKIALVSGSITTNSGNLNASALNGLNMVETMKSTGSENQFFNMWRHSQEKYQESRNAAIGLRSLGSIISGVHTAITGAVLLFVGAYFIIQGNFSLGMLVAFQSAWNVIRGELFQCMNMVEDFQSMRTNIERMDDIMERKGREPILIEDDGEQEKLRGKISVQDLCFRYHSGDKLTLKNVSFDVEPGQMIALVGPTGCGKSTIVKIIADLYQHESGKILYDGKSRKEISDAVFYSSVMAVDQEITIFQDSVKNNITMWNELTEDYEVLLAMKDAHIYERVIRDPDGYYALMKENGRNFSGGELQRVELARALCHEPTVLLLDEFTSALDAKTEAYIFDSIRERGVTCVIVAHRLSTISNCDKIIVLDRGEIVEQGTPEELYKKKGRYYELVNVQ